MTDKLKEPMMSDREQPASGVVGPDIGPKQKLDLVLKTDSFGTREAIVSAIRAANIPKVEFEVVKSGIGDISKNDLFLATTASRMVIGFKVDILPKVEELAKEHQVEVRLYDIIYKLVDDLQETAMSLLPAAEKEKITGKARVIAVFSGGRKGIILGCEVLEGTISQGNPFRVVSAPGTVYEGRVESLHIQKDEVSEAKPGQQVGLKILDFKRARIGDFVECFEPVQAKGLPKWRPRGGVFRY